MLAEFYRDLHGTLLEDGYKDLKVEVMEPETYLPEPPIPIDNFFEQAEIRVQLITLIRELVRLGSNDAVASPWASAARLLSRWNLTQNVSTFGRSVLAFSVLIRTAAYAPRQFTKLLRQANLSESSMKNLLAELNNRANPHLIWGLTWAELLMHHSPKSNY